MLRWVHGLAIATSVVLLAYFAARSWPTMAAVELLGPEPDTPEYIDGAVQLLRGQYGQARPPIYPPGFSLLLAPAVAIGGPSASGWVPFLAAVVLGIVSAVVAVRLSNPLAAPLAVFFVLFATAPRMLAQLVLTDLVVAALVLSQAVTLAFASGRAAAVLSGLLGGFLVWVRLASIPLAVAGLAGARGRRAAVWYVVGALPLLVLLPVWQWWVYGSPTTTGYLAVGAGPNGDGSMGSLFSLAYVLGPPVAADGPVHGGAAREWELPNLPFYALELLGADSFLFRPGVGLIGLVAAVVYATREPPLGAIARSALACTVATVAIYLPYFYQSGRFLAAPAALLAVLAAVALARLVETLLRRLAPDIVLPRSAARRNRWCGTRGRATD